MDLVVILLLTTGMGIVSVEMFSKAWLGFLGVLASLFLFFAGRIGKAKLWGRLQRHAWVTALCSGVLVLAFGAYSNYLGLGESQIECLAFMVTVVVRMVLLVGTLPQEIDMLFEE